ncbi:rhodanese-related sulfurtransferase [Cytobacillus eiseniae]|uniref:Rhodanese-related sulfurtransferase n=1 Tax=Cytobacillus eiseniae TaxID=762947 RepID=A0ABS4RIM1_9BACI|nr:rhodanese-like domain-containing protein [Cytobacillus eiseniae]MBP2242746.1 rhodanese-related sulfurtransferase [Cytobacillus eiseniae]
MKKHLCVLFSCAFLFVLAACSNNASYENIDNERAKEMIDNEQAEVIDVRSIEEYEAGHIPDATVLPLDEMNERISELDKDKTYILVCKSGNRSGQAGEILAENGFNDIYNIETGMNEWPYEVEKGL